MSVGVFIREPSRSDEREFVRAARKSKSLHAPWTAAPSTGEAFREYLGRIRPPTDLSFLVCLKADGAIAGVVNLTNIVFGGFQSGYLGYYAFSGFERQGVMTAGLGLVVRHAFTNIRLHRLEANIQPGNLPSLALVRRCGFSREGYSPKYLKINGRWRDHERWAIIAS